VIKKFIKKEVKNLQEVFRNKSDAFLIVAILSFIFLNTLKITAFNYYIMSDHSAALFSYKLLFTLFVVLIIYPFLFAFKSKAVLITFYVVQTLYIIINTSYYMYFQSYLHFSEAVSIVTEGFAAVKNAAAPISPLLLLVLIDLPILIWILRRYIRYPALTRQLRYIVLAVILMSSSFIYGIEQDNFAHKVSYRQSVKNYYEGESDIVARYGTLFNNILNSREKRDYSSYVSKIKYGEELINKKSTDEKPNFIFIQVESMDSNAVDQMHDGRYIAPFLHELSNNCVFYPYVMSYHMGGSTSDAEFSTINSVQPLADYPAIKLSNYDYPNSMVNKLSDASYSTLAFHGNVGGFFNRNLAFPKMGFQSFYDIARMGLVEKGWGASDGDVFDYTIKTLEKAKEPFFAYTITMSSHGPFTNASNYYNEPGYEDIKNKKIRNYYNSISYVDMALEKFVADVNENFDNTYVVIYGDHAPSVKSGGYTQASFLENKRYFEFVPLFIITPDKKVYRENRLAASFLDIAPTTLNAAGIDFDIKSDGLDLLAYPNSNKNIPYKSASYDRYSLYSKVPQNTMAVDIKMAFTRLFQPSKPYIQ
jgi:lipoteichoic acid synthase